MFTNPYFKALGAGSVRLVVPWDQEIHRHSWVTSWLNEAKKQKRQVFVVFGVTCNKAHCSGRDYIGSDAQYKRGVRLFIQRHRWIKYYSAFNEPNEGSSRIRSDLREYTRRFIYVAKQCARRCTQVGGEVAVGERVKRGGRDEATGWGRRFLRELKRQKGARYTPKIWGLHNYVDVNRKQVTWTKKWMQAFKGTIWFTETGAILNRPGGKRGTKDSPRSYSYPCIGTERCQNDHMRYLLGPMRSRLPQGRKRVQRIFIYQLYGTSLTDHFDAGLLGANGLPRLSYQTVRNAALHS
jgi:hypothetical protein